MKQFSYKAIEKSGESVSGAVEGANVESAAKNLQGKGLFIVSLTEKRELNFGTLFQNFNSVSGQDVAIFTRLLATMLSTGLPLTDALSNLSLQFKNTYFRDVIQSLLRDVQSGVSISEGMSRYPKVFNNLYYNLIKSGEASGKLDDTLTKLADTLDAQLDFSAKIRGAMVYPIIISAAAISIAVFMLTTIIPKIASVYTDFGAKLPLPTQILIDISGLLTNWWWLWFIVIGLTYFFFRTIRKNPVGDYTINNFIMRLPVFGTLNEEVAITILCRTLGTLISSGVAIIDAIKIVAQVMSNNYLRAGLLESAAAVEKGLPFSLALRRNGRFPQMVVQLCAIGEETGTLDKSLLRLAQFYQDSAERRIKTLTSALEPFLLIMMGVVVGGLALAVLLPMFNLVNVIK